MGFINKLSKLCAVFPGSPKSRTKEFEPTRFEARGGDWDNSGSDWADSSIMLADNTGNGPGNGQHPSLSGSIAGGQQANNQNEAARYDTRSQGPPQFGQLPPTTRQGGQNSNSTNNYQGGASSNSPDFHGFVPDHGSQQVDPSFSGVVNNSQDPQSYVLAPPLPFPQAENVQQPHLAMAAKTSESINDSFGNMLGPYAPPRTSSTNGLAQNSQPPNQTQGVNQGRISTRGQHSGPPIARQGSEQSGVSTIPGSASETGGATGFVASTPSHTGTLQNDDNPSEALSDALHEQIRSLMPIETPNGPMYQTTKGRLAAVVLDLIDYKPHIGLVPLFNRLKGSFWQNIIVLHRSQTDAQRSQLWLMWLELEKKWFTCQAQQGNTGDQNEQDATGMPTAATGGRAKEPANTKTPHDTQRPPPTPFPRNNNGEGQHDSSEQDLPVDLSRTNDAAMPRDHNDQPVSQAPREDGASRMNTGGPPQQTVDGAAIEAAIANAVKAAIANLTLQPESAPSPHVRFSEKDEFISPPSYHNRSHPDGRGQAVGSARAPQSASHGNPILVPEHPNATGSGEQNNHRQGRPKYRVDNTTFEMPPRFQRTGSSDRSQSNPNGQLIGIPTSHNAVTAGGGHTAAASTNSHNPAGGVPLQQPLQDVHYTANMLPQQSSK